jgi:predicted ThiF/HesA family dinucleotide-utilizing enzyme
VSVELPMKLSNKATLYNELGSASDSKNVKANGDKTVIENLKLIGGEIVIIKIAK